MKRRIPKSPRSLTIADINPAMLRKRFYYVDVTQDYPGNRDMVEMTRDEAAAYHHGQLVLANALNDLASTFGINTRCLPGDLILCKLNIVKMRKPRRNPWYRPALCPCDQRAAKNNAL